MGKRHYEDDDGRTIADMSSLEKRSVLSDWISRRGAGELTERRAFGLEDRTGLNRRDAPEDFGKQRLWQAEEFDREERRAAIRGALGAALLIGILFLAVFAAVIVLLLFLWGVL